ncbi:MAG: hypothetical protein RIQ46_1945 [Pseudomonadota bacterium]
MKPGQVQFLVIVERGPLEAQAVLLCESIRAFAGRHAKAAIVAVSPRPCRRPARGTLERLAALGVDCRLLDLASLVPHYGTSWRVAAAAHIARETGPDILVQLDSDTVFTGEPDLDLGDALALARPVDEAGMCSAGPHDPRDAHWQAMCKACGVDAEALGWVRATTTGQRLRASYNGGFIAARRDYFIAVEQVFARIAAAGLASRPDHRRTEQTGAGDVPPEGYAWWGTAQAALSIAAVLLGGRVRELDARHNVPLHLEGPVPEGAVHLHYHWLFGDADGVARVLSPGLCLGEDRRQWLAARLPLSLSPPEGRGLFSPEPVALPPVTRSSPACSVVMTCYRDSRFLNTAVASVLAQTFGDFELIVVDDGSPEPLPLAELERRDPRIRTLRLAENLGAAEAANRGVALARAPVIARLDADDLAEPGWLAAVMAALAADPELGLVGTAVRLMNEAGQPFAIQPMPESDFAIRFTLLFHAPLYHPTVAFRREAFEAAGGYRADRRVGADHWLWADMLPLCRARNLAAPLVRYRINPQGLTQRAQAGSPRAQSQPIRDAAWRELGLPCAVAGPAPGRAASSLLRGQPEGDAAELARAAAVVETALARALALRGQFIRVGDLAQSEAFAARLRSALKRHGAQETDLARRALSALRDGRLLAAIGRRLPLLRFPGLRVAASRGPA